MLVLLVNNFTKILCTIINKKSMKFIMPNSEHDYYKITVADNGVGFNPAYKKDLFRLFQRFHGKKYLGTGIGLSICQKIAEAHNGFIDAEGEEGKGAAFNIYLPIDKAIAY